MSPACPRRPSNIPRPSKRGGKAHLSIQPNTVRQWFGTVGRGKVALLLPGHPQLRFASHSVAKVAEDGRAQTLETRIYRDTEGLVHYH